MNSISAKLVFLFMLIFVLATHALRAQDVTSLSGTVTDSSESLERRLDVARPDGRPEALAARPRRPAEKHNVVLTARLQPFVEKPGACSRGYTPCTSMPGPRK